jgi:hypothetical protein
MATKISMCSNALLLIGHGTISSFTEGGAGALVASNLYDSSYENLLTLHRWRFASGKVSLSRLTATPLNEWDYAFQLPANYMLINRVIPQSDYEIFEDKIYSNQQTLDLDYVYKPAESELPAYFVKLVEYYLASQFSVPVTDNSTKGQLYDGMYQNQLRQAKFADASSRPPDAIASTPLWAARL